MCALPIDDAEEAEGQIVALVVDGKEVQQASADGVLGQEVMLVTNQTPFYGESGGQQGDRGAAFSADGGEMEVHDTQKKLGDLHVHSGGMTHGSLKVGAAVELRVEGRRRAASIGRAS